MRILAIETSCDETAIAIAEFPNRRGLARTSKTRTDAEDYIRVNVLSHIVSSQVKIHAAFGGVVPNLARREHEKNLAPMLRAALRESSIKNQELRVRKDKKSLDSLFLILDTILAREPELLQRFKKSIVPLTPPAIDAIAVTYGPGLAPALWTGVNFSRALAELWNKPLIPVNHMAGHLFSAFLQKSGEKDTKFQVPSSKFPILALLVSGGHTELVLIKKPWRLEIIGETRDDAVGEAFDKVGRILGLPYPGGPQIARLAEKGNPAAHALPRPMLHTKDYDFSFSGLKTAVLYLVRDLSSYGSYEAGPRKMDQRTINDIAASFQAAAIEVLVKKTLRAAKEYKVKTVALGGGVAANDALRAQLSDALQKTLPGAVCHMPEAALAGDNALMIATAAYFAGKPRISTPLSSPWGDSTGSTSAVPLKAGQKAKLAEVVLRGKKKSPDTDIRADANARLGNASL